MNTIHLPDGREISYELTRKRVKNINMRLGADGVLRVSASTRTGIATVEAAIVKNAEYFLRALEHRRQAQPQEGSFRWLGREYPVRVIRNFSERVALEDNELRIFTTHPEEAPQKLSEWAATQFAELIRELNVEVRNSLIAGGLQPPATRIAIKQMKSRWGSCSYTRGHISINSRLMAYPRETVLGVLWHEYSHYWHHDHSAKFYDFLLSHYPEYRKWDRLLKNK